MFHVSVNIHRYPPPLQGIIVNKCDIRYQYTVYIGSVLLLVTNQTYLTILLYNCNAYPNYILLLQVTSAMMLFLNLVSTHESVDFPIKFEEKELRERLSPQQYEVTQNQGTERYNVICV